MTQRLSLTRRHDEEIFTDILSRVDGCSTTGHWIIKDPKQVNSYLYLSKRDVAPLEARRHKPRMVPIKRVLYAIDRDTFVPKKNIKNLCGVKWCVNPAHLYIPGYEPTKDQICRWIEKDHPWLTVEEAKEWWSWVLDAKESKLREVLNE